MKKQTEADRRKEGIQSLRLRRRLLAWYRKYRRDLPWRRDADPYRIWISEIMLQQTQVDTVIPYYRRFLARFPDVWALAQADLPDVLKAWENLGYYARARNLHRAARIVAEVHGGNVPDNLHDLLALPGIGAYSAGAILSLAFGKPYPAVDGNVKRVLARIYRLEEPLSDRDTHSKIVRLAEALVPAKRPGDFNQALMDLGATVCIPGLPRCAECPVSSFCRACKSGRQSRIPVSFRDKALSERIATAALIRRRGRILIVRRPHEGLLGGLWKLPGGFAQNGETAEEALKRTVREETGMRIKSAEAISDIRHTFTHFRMTLCGFRCTVSGEYPPDAEGIRWIASSEITGYAFGKADRQILAKLIKPLSA